MESIHKTITNIPVPSRSGYQHQGADTEPCPVCGGLGRVRPADADSLDVHDPRFGKLIPCPACTQMRQVADGLTDAQQLLTWDDIAKTPEINRAVKAVRTALDTSFGWVYLHGPSGLAKSLILQIAIAETARKMKWARYANMIDIIDSLRLAFDTDNPSTEEINRLEQWSTVSVLAIDEFDRINNTEWSSNRKFQLLDRRYVDGVEGRSVTLLSSNSDPRTFPEYIRSRIFDGRFVVVAMTGKDFRPQMRK